MITNTRIRLSLACALTMLAACVYYVRPEDGAADPNATAGGQSGDTATNAGQEGEAGSTGASIVSVELPIEGVTLALSTRTDDAVGWIEARYTVPSTRVSVDPCGHGEAMFGTDGAIGRRVAFPAGVPVPGQTSSASERRFDLLLDALRELAREPDTTTLTLRLCGISGTLAFDAASRNALRELVATLDRLRAGAGADVAPVVASEAVRVVRGYAARSDEPAASGYYQTEARFTSSSWAVSVVLASPTAGLADRVFIDVELVGNVPRRCNGALTVAIDDHDVVLPAAAHHADAGGDRHHFEYATGVENLMPIGEATEAKLTSCYGDTSLDAGQRAALGSLVAELARIDGGR